MSQHCEVLKKGAAEAAPFGEFYLVTRQDDALAHIGGIAHGDGVALSQVIEPGVHISSSQVVLNLIVAVSLTRGADKIHHLSLIHI